jgi:hypothetical protein
MSLKVSRLHGAFLGLRVRGSGGEVAARAEWAFGL